ncbi:hypothetical protein [Stackebrandtia nassauensis]|uniref:Uncharacterized protein n=1 Tax=Stackebrandtia nassauensis (strain DSM 44728 / CIP 108903 / NRRL B-16338 / NBRC 102104 / LLR-40K-21) TaxID=446470 RepID=D3PU20_STANL|nr:hypothetical protein [Stackebrandtia nassauensis]ADD40966.1 hypothetical protein Snas_1256 [Stackebrandtia nassauensis DSM 44728]
MKTSDTSSEAEGGAADEADSGEAVTEVPTKGRPTAFVLLTCGFLACMCCVGGVFAGGSLGWMRMSNLDDVVTGLGEPDGWSTTDASSTPWRAEASLTGPADAEAVARWLSEVGAETSETKASKCLATKKGCTVELKSGGFPVKVEYGPDGENAEATVLVD